MRSRCAAVRRPAGRQRNQRSPRRLVIQIAAIGERRS
jgi:hypothetical protein